MKRQKPLYKKHWRNEFINDPKKYFRKEERRLAKSDLKKEMEQK